jgi:hemolysin III
VEFREPFCAVVHLITAAWALLATPFLVRLAHPGRKFAAATFGVSMGVLFLASGLFHGLPYTAAEAPAEFRFFQRLDQSAIFLLIAGTNTPPLVALVGGRWGKTLLRGIWGSALTGIVCLWALPKPPHAVIVGVSLLMGWLGMLPLVRYYAATGWRAMNWVWAGAGFYTAGGVCEFTDWPTVVLRPVRVGPHEVFHLLVTLASGAFFVYIFRFVIRYRAAHAPHGFGSAGPGSNSTKLSASDPARNRSAAAEGTDTRSPRGNVVPASSTSSRNGPL